MTSTISKRLFLFLVLTVAAQAAFGQDGILDKYSSVTKIKPGFFLVSNDVTDDSSSTPRKKYGVIDFEGNVILAANYDEITAMDDGYSVVRKNDVYGIVNPNYITVVPCQFSAVGSFNEKDVVWVCKNGKFGVYNRKGTAIVPPRYEKIGTFSSDNSGDYRYVSADAGSKLNLSTSDCIVVSEDGSHSFDGIVSLSGKVLLAPGRYEHIFAPESGMIPVSKTEDGLTFYGLYIVDKDSLSPEGWSSRKIVRPAPQPQQPVSVPPAPEPQQPYVPEPQQQPAPAPQQSSGNSVKLRPSVPSTPQKPYFLP